MSVTDRTWPNPQYAPKYEGPMSHDWQDALKAVLLFHDGKQWTTEKADEWLRITGTREASTKVLCDHIRAIFAICVDDMDKIVDAKNKAEAALAKIKEIAAQELKWRMNAETTLTHRDTKLANIKQSCIEIAQAMESLAIPMKNAPVEGCVVLHSSTLRGWALALRHYFKIPPGFSGDVGV